MPFEMLHTYSYLCIKIVKSLRMSKEHVLFENLVNSKDDIMQAFEFLFPTFHGINLNESFSTESPQF